MHLVDSRRVHVRTGSKCRNGQRHSQQHAKQKTCESVHPVRLHLPDNTTLCGGAMTQINTAAQAQDGPSPATTLSEPTATDKRRLEPLQMLATAARLG